MSENEKDWVYKLALALEGHCDDSTGGKYPKLTGHFFEKIIRSHAPDVAELERYKKLLGARLIPQAQLHDRISRLEGALREIAKLKKYLESGDHEFWLKESIFVAQNALEGVDNKLSLQPKQSTIENQKQ